MREAYKWLGTKRMDRYEVFTVPCIEIHKNQGSSNEVRRRQFKKKIEKGGSSYNR